LFVENERLREAIRSFYRRLHAWVGQYWHVAARYKLL